MGRTFKVLKNRAQAKKFTFKYQVNTSSVEGQKGRYYPADDVVVKKGPAPVRNPTKIRSNITPGTVLILLAGRFAGKRVVCLKVLSSGLLLVSGPYVVNGVPLRRVNQRYVIATSTKVNLTGVDVASIDDAFFARAKNAEGEKLSPARKAAQEKVDAALQANISKVSQLGDYLKNKFSLSRNDKPHLLKF
mmetsp:Transcript_31532/g.23391  ORF Transcript_31532/g.23391 Transcript_31532/m.23391 type:complete len:190 (+) Transcript_31532:33-602(+)|eukprot:CAMPEP_0202971048 /NCGR_PEP_ID=MMETSP1396-20130829/23220_1 /ASSEMBLY_ACC=CAM_ASM_000872 /TAXON_ID= /ORGANISM="Pseudokeronopsis sp., Strain Brazil" /LENGTH=189 /DNA_ID=CAMNT_0049700017 /DNA_START=29 /DNA_END=598 /DNA_ORIENTATION=+